ncbi:glycine zipper domain-containing protein [Rhizobium sp. WW22]|uniref:glycine zipper domain-containing protein n=1 Tax=Rhizobium sp. WW22 TaxID=3389070 RepID=UPI000DDB106D
MATSILHSARGKRNGSSLHDVEASIEDQIESLREEVAAFAKLIGESGTRHSKKLRATAESNLDDLTVRGEELLRDLQRGYTRGSREVRRTVRQHPVATIGAAAAFGLAVALLLSRR